MGLKRSCRFIGLAFVSFGSLLFGDIVVLPVPSKRTVCMLTTTLSSSGEEDERCEMRPCSRNDVDEFRAADFLDLACLPSRIKSADVRAVDLDMVKLMLSDLAFDNRSTVSHTLALIVNIVQRLSAHKELLLVHLVLE